MTGSIETRLEELGVTLPEAPAPAANYVPYVIAGDLVHISGQLPVDATGMVTGKLGEDCSIEEAAAAARLCAINLLSQLKAACGGDFERLVRVVKLGAFVNSTPDFTEQPKVVNGCSDFLVEVLGERGRHARSAVASPSLPFGVAVEIDGIFQIK